MTDQPTAPHLVTKHPQECAVVRETVPMSALTEFFGRAFAAAMAAAAAQGRHIVGPPFGVYFGMPTDTVDVAAGFPVDAPIAAADGVTPYRLPGGDAVELLHHGPYDAMSESYDRLLAWMGEHELTAAQVMWESYLNEPQAEHPQATRTLLTWPVV